MGVLASEVLLCPYRYLEYIMVIQYTDDFYNAVCDTINITYIAVMTSILRRSSPLWTEQLDEDTQITAVFDFRKTLHALRVVFVAYTSMRTNGHAYARVTSVSVCLSVCRL